MNKITSSYIRDLAVIYHHIDNRGMLFDENIMSNLRYDLSNKIDQLLTELSFNWNCHVFTGTENSKGKDGAVNLNSGGEKGQLLKKLKELNYEIPKVRKKNKETYEVEYKEGVEELVLRKIFAETGSSDIKRILEIRELVTLLQRYINAKRLEGVFYSCYNTAGTITGRRGCKKHTFGLGGNAQTFPKHYSTESACYRAGQKFLQGVISRPNKIFFLVDQMSAEDWPTNALAENYRALEELKNQVDRHTILASNIFNIPIEQITKDSIERYLGKKSRHSNNYGVRGATMSDSLAREGFAYSPQECQELLDKVNIHDPSIDLVFHKYIRDTVINTQTLRTPFSRERHFHGLRQNNPNYQIFNEAYSYIPQSVVGDNTGFAVYHIERNCGNFIVHEGHDSITQEVDNDLQSVTNSYEYARQAFDREITFHNGIRINIPIEGEMGYNLKDTVKISPFTEEGVRLAYEKLKDTQCQDHTEQQMVV